MKIMVAVDDSNPTLLYAGEELISHLGMLQLHSPASCDGYSVSLLVSGAAQTQADSFSYCFTKSAGKVVGNNARSVLLGVYSYLRNLGFVFLRPGKGGTSVPHITAVNELYRDSAQTTAALYQRGVCIEGAESLENTLDFIEWMPKNGFNAFFVQFKTPDVFFERWHSHVFNPLLPKEALSRARLDAMDTAVTEAIQLRGIMEHRVGHGWTAEAMGFANAGWRVETAELTAEVQPIIAQIAGRRELWGGNPTNTNLCYANTTARHKLVENMISYSKSHPTVDFLHFWLADEYNNICECDECTRTTLADQYVELLNEMDARLTQEKLPTKIVFLLYQELLYAPLKERLHNCGRFCLMFAPISRTFNRSYPPMPKSATVLPHQRNKMVLPVTLEENLRHYLSWKRIFTGETFFYDYPLGRAHFGDFGYMKISKIIYEDIHALKSLGSDGYMSCQELRAQLPTAFPNFVMGQALCNQNISYETLRETYFKAMFGEHYLVAVKHLEELSANSDMDYFNGKGERVQPEKAAAFYRVAALAQDFLARAAGIHSAAAPAYQYNWEILLYHARYCILLGTALAKLCSGDQAANSSFQEFCSYIQQNEQTYQPVLDVYRVIEVATKYTGFDLTECNRHR